MAASWCRPIGNLLKRRYDRLSIMACQIAAGSEPLSSIPSSGLTFRKPKTAQMSSDDGKETHREMKNLPESKDDSPLFTTLIKIATRAATHQNEIVIFAIRGS